MKIKIIIFLLVCFSLESVEINIYKQLEIIKIKIGSSKGEMGYDVNMAQMGGNAGPTVMYIANNNLIYIGDNINSRINIYDLNFNLEKVINSKKEYSVRYLYEIKRDDQDNLILLDSMLNLIKINSNGDLLFKIQQNELASDITSKMNFFPYQENILFYDSKSEEKIKFFDPKGKILDKFQSQKILNKLQNALVTQSFNYEAVIKIQAKIKKISDDKKIVFDKKPLTVDFKLHRDYYNALKGNKISTISKQMEIMDRKEFSFPQFSHRNHQFIGFDSDGNSYWRNKVKSKPIHYVIIILSPYGEILDAFYNNIKWSLVAVAPSGDVYFLSYMIDTEYVYFYKTERVW